MSYLGTVTSPLISEPVTASGLRQLCVGVARLGWPGLLWIGLWANYNSGPWHLTQTPDSYFGWLHAGRATLAFVVPALAVFTFGRRSQALRIWNPTHVWLVYSVFVFVGGVASGQAGFNGVYWTAAYVGGILAASSCIRPGREIVDAESLNRLTWFISLVVIVTLVIVARDSLIEGSGLSASGYGVLDRTPSVAGMVMSRSTGMARFAAVPSLVALGLALQGKGAWRIVGLAAYLCGGVFLYIMQGRGATAGYIGGTFFMLLCSGRGGRTMMILLIVALVGAAVFNAIPTEIIDHLTRGQSVDQLKSMSGRDRAWENAWAAVSSNPLIGYGFEADRWMIGEHVHNTYMYALVAGGIPGLGLFVGGLVWAWALFVKLLRHPGLADSGQKLTLIQVGGVLAFFTLRSIPEVCGSNYAVDYMVMLPAILYVHVLWCHLKKAPARQPLP